MMTADKIALWNMAVTFLAVVLAPLVALIVGGYLQRVDSRRRQKLELLGILLSVRHMPLSPDAVKPLNMIDVVFADDRNVREAWSRYYAALSDQRNNNDPGRAQWDEKKRDLILTMAQSVGLRNVLTTSDVLRTYQPTFIAKMETLSMMDLDIRLAEAEAKTRAAQPPPSP